MQRTKQAPKTILVTGCAGFIGSNFVRQFKLRFPKTQIVGIDDFSTGRRDRIDPSSTFYEKSILDAPAMEAIFKKHRPEYVFHFAALPRVAYSVEHPIETTEANILGTVTLLTCANNHGVRRFIFSSSSSVYGGAKKLPTRESENEPHPRSPYAAQKYCAEELCKVWSSLYGLDTVCLRYFNVFGPGQYGNSPYATVISAWLESIYFPVTKKAFIEGSGSQSRDFCYVDNVVMANIQAMLTPKRLGGVQINIAHGERTSLKEVHRLIEANTRKKLVLEKRPERNGDVRHTHADITLAKRLIHYRPAISFSEGLARTIAWYEERSNTQELALERRSVGIVPVAVT